MSLNNYLKTKKPMKLYTRIVLFFTGVFFIVFLLAFILLFFFSQTLIQQVNRENLYDFNRSIVNIIEENKKDILVLPESERLPYVATLIEPIVKDNNQIEYKLSDNKSNTFRSSISIDAVINPENFDSSRSVYKYFITNSSQFFSSSSANDVDIIRYGRTEYNYIGLTCKLNDDYQINIQSIKSLKDIYTFMNILYVIQIIICLVVFGLVVIIGIYGTKATLRPLIEIADAAKHITENNLNTRIPETGNDDEIDDLIKSLNQMIEKLEKAFDSQKQFVANASHELRLPLTVIKGYADILSDWGADDESIREEALKAIKEEIENTQKLINSLLRLTRIENTFAKESLTLCDIGKAIAKDAEELSRVEEMHNYHLQIEPDCFAMVNIDLVKQAFRAVTDNAIKYTPEGGDIFIVCEKIKDYIAITVKDTGVGIPESDLEIVTSRFYRVSDGRNGKIEGHGLGLAIVKDIVDLHGGQLSLKSDGKTGTRVTMSFPVKPNTTQLSD